MKKILMVLSLVTIISNAEAQQKCTCPPGVKHTHKHTASVSHNQGKTGDRFAQNFKVCKDPYGYKICGQRRNGYNSTAVVIPQQQTPQSNIRNYNSYTWLQDKDRYDNTPAEDNQNTNSQLAPESQSYPTSFTINKTGSYSGYYPKKSNIKVGYDNGTAPYEGEPSPQYDGPDKNKARNLKVNSPEQNSTDPSMTLPPPSGTIMK
jgi:hypothetical protein